MSAYVVDRECIWYIVQCAEHYGIRWKRGDKDYVRIEPATSLDTLVAFGNMLWEENIKSVMARYPGDTRNSLPGPCDETFDLADGPRMIWPSLSAVQAIKACDCYSYQSCEHPGWENSEAKRVIEGIVGHATSSLPGYGAASWGAPKQKPMQVVGQLIGRN